MRGVKRGAAVGAVFAALVLTPAGASAGVGLGLFPYESARVHPRGRGPLPGEHPGEYLVGGDLPPRYPEMVEPTAPAGLLAVPPGYGWDASRVMSYRHRSPDYGHPTPDTKRPPKPGECLGEYLNACLMPPKLRAVPDPQLPVTTVSLPDPRDLDYPVYRSDPAPEPDGGIVSACKNRVGATHAGGGGSPTGFCSSLAAGCSR